MNKKKKKNLRIPQKFVILDPCHKRQWLGVVSNSLDGPSSVGRDTVLKEINVLINCLMKRAYRGINCEF